MSYHILIGLLGCALISCSSGTATFSAAKPSDTSDPVRAVTLTGTWPPPAVTPAAIRAIENPSNTPTLNSNLWEQMQDDMALPDTAYMKPVESQIAWFKRRQVRLNKVLKEASPYIAYVYQQTQKRNMPAEIALLPIIESEYNPYASSYAGATGIWQLMPGTASGYGLKIDWWYDGRRDIVASTKAALDYLDYLHQFFMNNWLLAIAAYNSGEGTVKAAVDYNKRHDLPTDFWSLHLPQQTKCYVPKVLALACIIRDPYRYKVNLLPVTETPCLEQVKLDSQINLTQAAHLAGMTTTQLRKLNPGFRRWATDPTGPNMLLLPASKAQAFSNKLDSLPKTAKQKWRSHRVIHGDTLSTIAHKNHISIKQLKTINHLHNDNLKIGQVLRFTKYTPHYAANLKPAMRAEITEDRLPGPRRVLYTVRRRDTLISISRKFGIKPSHIRFWNHQANKQTLTPNTKLIIWLQHKSRPAPRYITTYYRVKSGDTLSGIAKRFHTTTARIRAHNKLRSNLLHVGTKLKMLRRTTRIYYRHRPTRSRHVVTKRHTTGYAVHIVKRGETAQLIAHRNHLTVATFCRINHLKTSAKIYPGDQLFVPKQTHHVYKTTHKKRRSLHHRKK